MVVGMFDTYSSSYVAPLFGIKKSIASVNWNINEVTNTCSFVIIYFLMHLTLASRQQRGI